MGRRRGGVLILAAAAACLLLAGIAAYGQYAIVDEDAFADRAVSTLQSDEVRQDAAHRIAMRVVQQRPELMPREAAIEADANTQITDNPEYAAGFRAAAARLHHVLFTDADATAALQVRGSGFSLRTRLQTVPGLRSMPAIGDPSLLAVEATGREGALRALAPPARVAAGPGGNVLRLA